MVLYYCRHVSYWPNRVAQMTTTDCVTEARKHCKRSPSLCWQRLLMFNEFTFIIDKLLAAKYHRISEYSCFIFHPLISFINEITRSIICFRLGAAASRWPPIGQGDYWWEDANLWRSCPDGITLSVWPPRLICVWKVLFVCTQLIRARTRFVYFKQ